MVTLNDLQQRVAVARERNRTNNERRAQFLATIKEKFGCNSLEELKALGEKKRAELADMERAEADARARAEAAVVAVETAVGVKA